MYGYFKSYFDSPDRNNGVVPGQIGGLLCRKLATRTPLMVRLIRNSRQAVEYLLSRS
jgi:hypothetical protein